MNNGPNLTAIERSTLERIRQIQKDECLSRRESTVSTLSNLSLDTIATTGRLLDHLGLESLVGSDDNATDEEDNLSIVYDDENKIKLAKSQTNSSTSTLKDVSMPKQRDDEHDRDTAKNNYVSAQNFRSLKQRFHTSESLTNKIDLSSWKDAQVLESASHPTHVSNNNYWEHRVSYKPETRQNDSDQSSNNSQDEASDGYGEDSKTSFSHEKSQSQTIPDSWRMTDHDTQSATEPEIESPRRKRFTVFGTDSSSYIPSPPRIRSPLFKRLSGQMSKEPGVSSSPKKNPLNLHVHQNERETLARFLDSNDIDYATIPQLPAALTTQLNINPDDLPSPTQRNFHKHSNSHSSISSQETANMDRVSLALKLRNSGKLRESSYQLEKASHEGNEQAMMLYALALRYGDGVRKDNVLSFQWLTKIFLSYFPSLSSFLREPDISPFALNAENIPSSPKEPIASALYELGKCYMTGLGVTKDEAVGLKFLERSASMGIVDAMCEVGMIWSNKSKHRKKDLYKASAWLRLADKFHAPLVGVSWIYKEKYFPK